MDQELRLEPTAPVTQEEVRALIQRFGERETTASDQATVGDVAEALQLEPTTVGSMLVELRSSKSQRDIRARLDRLEEENAELRQRAEDRAGPMSLISISDGGRTARMALLAALCFLTVLTVVGGLTREPQWWLGVVPITFALIALSRYRRT